MADETESSREPGGALSAKEMRRKRCYICREKFERYFLFKSSCSHKFCQPCLERLFRDSLPEAKFPPKCCDTPIPETANELLPKDLVATLQLKEIEYGIPIEKRLFCSGCATIISPWDIDGPTMTGSCGHCGKKTCVRCYRFEHEGRCQIDGFVDELKKMSLENKWMTCYRCGQTVEKLGDDCDHITCVCGAEFCYQCSAKWKTCSCYHEEFPFDGPTNANFRAANPDITSAMQIDEDNDTEESIDVDMDVEDHEPANQQAKNPEMEIDREEETSNPNTNRPQQDQPTAEAEPDNHDHFRIRKRYVPIQAAEASSLVEATAAVLAQHAPKPGPNFPKRNWACSHNDYHAIHHGGPFNCADCAVIQPKYILQCKKCRIHLCVRCAHLYEDHDGWDNNPPRGRSKPERSQQVWKE